MHEGRVTGPDGQALGDYWSLLTATDLDQEYAGHYPPKRPEDRTLLGRTLLPRPDLKDKVLGHPRFVHDLRLPGMWHGRVLRAPLLDAPLAASASDVLQALRNEMPQVQAWADGRFVAVVAERERILIREGAHRGREDTPRAHRPATGFRPNRPGDSKLGLKVLYRPPLR